MPHASVVASDHRSGDVGGSSDLTVEIDRGETADHKANQT